MSQSLADVVLHIVFTTKGRKQWLQPLIEEELYSYITAICKNLNCPLVQINGTTDHIHVLLALSRTITISKLISEIKSGSSRWIKTKGVFYKDFAWQGGYGAFSVARPSIDKAINYIASQKEHHKTVSFQDEFVSFLKRAKIKYDEKYFL